MTRTHAREPEPYRLAAVAQAQGAVVRQQSPLQWARAIHTQWQEGQLRPRKEPCDAASLRKSCKPENLAAAMSAAVRGENGQRLRSMMRAIRQLSASGDAKDKRMAGDLSKFLANAWGVTLAHEAVAEGEVEVSEALREKWGKVQLPPVDATVNGWAADELLIQAAVRRLG